MNTQTQEALKIAIEALQQAHSLAFKEIAGSPPDEVLFEDAIQACKEVLEQPAQEPAWDDKQDEWSDEIAQSHPLKTKRNIEYDIARKMVSNRHSKNALVDLVCWLLQKAHPAPAREPIKMLDDNTIDVAINNSIQSGKRTFMDVCKDILIAHGIEK